MPTGPSGSVLVVIVGPPSLAGTRTDVTNYGRAPSYRLTESSRSAASSGANACNQVGRSSSGMERTSSTGLRIGLHQNHDLYVSLSTQHLHSHVVIMPG